ncbi:hypothetical protein RI054_19g87580 [Pseudoscourfieldia marina]
MRASSTRLSRVHVSETDAPEKKKFNIQAGFGVMFMRVARTLCAPSASPALTKAARRCLLARATTRDARELDAAKPGASLRVLPPAMRASSTRLSRVHVSETDAPEKKKFNIQAGFGVMFMRVSRTLCAPSASPALTKVARRCLLAPTTTRDARELDAAKPGVSSRLLPPAMRASSTRLSRVHVSETDAPEKKKFNIQAGFGVMFMRVSRTLCAPSASPALTKAAHRCLLARATTRDARELDAAKPGASLRVLPPAMRASSTRLSRVHVSETDAPEKKKFNIQAGFGVMFMRVSRTLCAPSASPALTKAAHRCLLAPTTTRDARELDAAKPGVSSRLLPPTTNACTLRQSLCTIASLQG